MSWICILQSRESDKGALVVNQAKYVGIDKNELPKLNQKTINVPGKITMRTKDGHSTNLNQGILL